MLEVGHFVSVGQGAYNGSPVQVVWLRCASNYDAHSAAQGGASPKHGMYAYKAHVKPEQFMCACDSKLETCNHLFLHGLHYASPRATLLSTLRRISPSLAYLLRKPRTTTDSSLPR